MGVDRLSDHKGYPHHFPDLDSVALGLAALIIFILKYNGAPGET